MSGFLLKIKSVLICVICGVVLLSCQKQEAPTYVTFKVFQQASSSHDYSVSYTGSGNVTKSVGPINSPTWESEVVKDKKRNDFVSLTVEDASSGANYKMYIYLNGVLFLEGVFSGPGSKTISGNLPPEGA